MRFERMAVLGVVVLAGGCHSAYVEADVKNGTATAVSLVEVDYPSASFGVGSLAAGEMYHYRFKILGSGGTKVMWTDAAQKEHSATGPELREGQEGPLVVTITGENATWDARLKP